MKLGNEQCDDGNAKTGDGCSATCQIEKGYNCTGSPSVCSSTCGDGVVAANEQCDDGGKVNGDGCSDTCSVEPGFMCTGSPSVCTQIL
jgi:cysteine-rich repeat protein